MSRDDPSLSHDGASWLRSDGAEIDVVMSSRARVARNLNGFPFMIRADGAQRLEILDTCHGRIAAVDIGQRMLWINLHETERDERMLLVERHLISKQHARGKQANGSGGTDEPRAVAVGLPDERLSIMINEEDHLRIQSIGAGLALESAYAEVDRVDDLLEDGLDFAYSPRFGYLTACPTNLGTGVRMSVMLHLPALRITGDIEKVRRAAQDMSLAVRGFHGEGSDAAGDLFQISNQTTLGRSESVILHDLQNEIIPRVIEYERTARNALRSRRQKVLEDKCHRALGGLLHARLMGAAESMQLLSHVRLGVVMGVLDELTLQEVNHLFLLTQPGHLQRAVGQTLSQDQRREARATLLRSRLGG